MIENRYTQRGGRPPKRVYVARTVEERQPRMERFLNRVGRHLGRMAAVKTIGSTHVTFLESNGTRRAFSNLGYTPADVRTFSAALQQYLDDKQPRADVVAHIDMDQPLVWKGQAADKLSLNVLPDEGLLEERERIEGFLLQRFGRVPTMQQFEPHVTIGRVDHYVLDSETRSNPGLLLPEHLDIPSQVTLNGLMVYLNNIGSA